jgi:hypothetical protein
MARVMLQRGHGVTLLDSFGRRTHDEETTPPSDLRSESPLLRSDIQDLAARARTVPGRTLASSG